MIGDLFLVAAAIASGGVAAVHLAGAAVGPAAYRFLGAGERMAAMAEAGSRIPALLTVALAIVFAGCGVYALSGAGVVSTLPGVAVVLVAVGAAFTLRGIAVIPQVLGRRVGRLSGGGRGLAFSAVSLAIGLLYDVGVALNWSSF